MIKAAAVVDVMDGRMTLPSDDDLLLVQHRLL